MKQSYTDYLNELSGNRMDILEELITKKYKKFRKFYKIVSKYSSDIAHISYRFSEEDSLDIDITVNSNVDIDKFLHHIDEETEGKYSLEICVDTRVLYMSITRID